MARQTREERLAAEAAARRSTRIREFREGFLRDVSRRVYDKKTAFAVATVDKSAMALYGMVREFEDTQDHLTREMRSAIDALTEGLARLADGREPFYFSNGITGRNGVDIDKYATRLEAQRKAIVRLAETTGWRVREIEDTSERAFGDSCERLSVIPRRYGDAHGWSIVRAGDDGISSYFNPSLEAGSLLEKFDEIGFIYDSEEAVWAAMAAIVTGRAIDA